MNLHLFYLKLKNAQRYDPFNLYAYTTDKQLAKTFLEERDESQFVYRKEEDIDKFDFRRFEQVHSGKQLHYGNFYTKSDKMFGKRKSVEVLCTWNEEESVVKNTDLLWMEYRKCLFDPKAFKDEYLKALESLMFISLYGFYGSKDFQSDSFYSPYFLGFHKSELIKYPPKNFSYDEFQIFLHFYTDMFLGENTENES